MKNGQGPTLEGFADVVFVGGPFHGRRIGMAYPEFLITFELDTGERVEYCRRMVEAEMRDGCYRNIATYAPTGISDQEFLRLVVNAAAGSPEH